MPNIIRFLAVLIAVVALSPHSYSQTVGNDLEGVRSVKIIVKIDDKDAGSCALTEDSLRSAAAFPVATSRLSLNETSPVTLYIFVLVARLDNIGCAASLTVSVRTFQIADLDATALSKLVQIRL